MTLSRTEQALLAEVIRQAINNLKVYAFHHPDSRVEGRMRALERVLKKVEEENGVLAE